MSTNGQNPYRVVVNDPASFATTLVTCFLDAYGTEALDWSPSTVRVETVEDWGATWPAATFDRLMAAIHILKSDAFYKSLPDFIELCLVLNGAPFTPTVWQPAAAEDCAWGITEAMLISPPDADEEEPFTMSICAYIAEATRAEGIITPPDVLRIALPNDDATRVQADFSDDPEMSSAMWHMQDSKTEDINSMIRNGLAALAEQLNKLHLHNGDASQAVNKMRAALKAKPQGGSPLV